METILTFERLIISHLFLLVCYMFYLHHLTTNRLIRLGNLLAAYAKPVEDMEARVEEIIDKFNRR